MIDMRLEHLLIFSAAAVVVWFLVTYFWPSMLLYVFRRAILAKGFGDGSIPVNSMRTQPEALFADPIHPPASAPRVAIAGVNHDTLLTVGWLDLSRGAQVLHVPEMDGRYYSVQFTDPSKNSVFAYVGTRTTGTGEGDYVITGPAWRGQVPSGMSQIPSPTDSALVIGRVLVHADSDVSTAHRLAEQVRLAAMDN